MKRLSIFIIAVLQCINVWSQETDYRRSSIYSVLVYHPELEFGKDIDTVFRQIPLPERYNDHNLKIREIVLSPKTDKKSKEDPVKLLLDNFIINNTIAKRLVAQWFNRKSGKGQDGTFDVNLVIERGLYDASWYEAQMANMSIRGQSLLADAGEELIGNTYVIFNDIKYVDKTEAANAVSYGLTILGGVASQATGGLSSIVISAATGLSTGLADNIAGFRVRVKTYLYRLDWTEEIANTFYSDYYMTEPDAEKKKAFDLDKSLFTMSYVGSQELVTGETSLRGVATKNDMIRKVCTRAIDMNIALLQHSHEEFRVKTPLFSASPIQAKIGLKEDVSEKSRFEVLEAVADKNGVMTYKRVGIIKPKKGRIWDNRYMAEFEDENEGSDLTSTEFEVVSGSGFYPGMLIREI